MRLPWLHISLVFSLLACPLNCMGALEFADDAPRAQGATCGCCHHQSDDSSPQAPHAPTEECPCPTCLCNGAVTIGDDVLVDFDRVAGSLTSTHFVAVDYDESSRACTMTPLESYQPQRNSLPAGSAARIVNQSFLL